jgi:hypothetical protein
MARTPGEQQHEQRATVEPAELVVLDEEAVEVVCERQRRRIVEPRVEKRKVAREDRLVRRVVEIDAGDDRREGPRARGIDRCRVDDRRIETASTRGPARRAFAAAAASRASVVPTSFSVYIHLLSKHRHIDYFKA